MRLGKWGPARHRLASDNRNTSLRALPRGAFLTPIAGQ